ncbi:Kinesin-like protein kip2 [Cryptotrichosporon argae]
MSLTPSTSHRLSRTPSSPSLAVGLPPPLPDDRARAMPASAKKKKSKKKQASHRGDVSSSAASSPYNSDAELSMTAPSAPPTPTPTAAASAALSTPTPKTPTSSSPTKIRAALSAEANVTPKRKIAALDPATPKTGKKRETLAERLEAAAKVNQSAPPKMPAVRPIRTSRSGGISASSSVHELGDAITLPYVPSTPSKVKDRDSLGRISLDGRDKASDKVVVCMRIKPTKSDFVDKAYHLAPTSLSLSDAHPNVVKRGGKSGREAEYTYNFDMLLQFPARTPHLYAAKVAPLVGKAMNGFNSTIFAYGQTGSGKSFTMTGTADELGIIPCAVDGVFDSITADTDRAFLLRVSYIEIYNETLRDLLNFKKGSLKDDEKPVIHTAKNRVYVEPLVEEIVSTPQDVVDLLERGNLNRKVGATDWDLAGSEKAVSDVERRGEGKHINQSLLALREVVHKLTEKGKRSHIPYRNSKLTHLLENALGGDSNICVICTMSAEEEHCSETLETLKFAGRCSQVETKAKKNVLMSSDRAVIRAKDLEIEALKAQLQTMSGSQRDVTVESSEQIAELADSVAAMEARKAKLTAQLAKLNGEILTSELPRSTSNLPLSPPRKKRPRISDFTLPGSGRLALGLGTPKKGMGDRRAVSGMTRLLEDEEMPAISSVLESEVRASTSFERDRTIAALRRAISVKDEELASLSQRLADALVDVEQLRIRTSEIDDLRVQLDATSAARAALEESSRGAQAANDVQLRDMHVQLESTRAELVSTIADKSAKIDTLENAVLELRKSREELVIEDEKRVEEVRQELARALEENEALRTGSDEAATLRSKLDEAEKVAEGLRADRSTTREVHAGEVGRIRAAVHALKTEAETTERALADSQARVSELEVGHAAAERDMDEQRKLYATADKALDDLRKTHVTIAAERDAARAEREAVEKERDDARADLDRFQKAAMARESDLVGELRAELAKERAARAEDAAAADAVRAELGRVKDEAGAAAARRDELAGSLATERERAGAGAADVEAERARTKAAELEVLRLKGAMEGTEAREKEMALRVEQAARDAKTLEDKLAAQQDAREAAEARASEAAGFRRRVAELEAEVAATTARLDGALAEFARLREEAEAADAAKVELQALLDAERTRRTIADDRAATLQTELDAARAEAGAARGVLDEAVGKTSATQARLDETTAALSSAEQRLKGALDQASRAGRAQDELDVLAARMDEVAAERAALRKQLEASRVAHAEALDAVKTEHMKALDAASNEHARTLDAVATENQEAMRKLFVQLDKARTDADAAVRVANERVDVGKVEAGKAARLERDVADLRRKMEELVGERGRLKLAAAETKAAVEQATSRADTSERKAADAAAELAKGAAARLALETKLADAAQALVVSRTEAENARVDADAAKARADSLGRQLVEAQAQVAAPLTAAAGTEPKQRHSTPPLFAPSSRAAALDSLRKHALTTAATGDGVASRLRMKEADEIARLEKVVEAQKVMIEDQRAKIKHWAEELEKQREVVRLLTQPEHGAPGATPAATTGTPTRSPHQQHAKSVSLVGVAGSPSAPRSPLPAAQAHYAAAAPLRAPHLPSTFTAHNLALPSTPTPLPMHHAQVSNARRNRRVTIEHDIDRLAESSKVNKIKSVFDTPEKPGAPVTPVKAPAGRVPREGQRSVPRQRRP